MTWARGITKGSSRNEYYSHQINKLAAHNEETRALIKEYKRLYELPYADEVLDYQYRWQDMTQLEIATYRQKCEFLSELVATIQNKPEEAEAELIIVMLIMCPIRRSVGKTYVKKLRELRPANIMGADRKNLKILHDTYMERELDRSEVEELFSDLDFLSIHCIFEYQPFKCSGNWFGYFNKFFKAYAAEIFRTKYAARYVHESYVDVETAQADEALSIADFDGFRRWQSQLSDSEVDDFVDLLYITKSYESSSSLRKACKDAIRRLPKRQSETIDAIYYQNQNSIEIACKQKVADSTVRRNHQKSLDNLQKDKKLANKAVELGAVRRSVLEEVDKT